MRAWLAMAVVALAAGTGRGGDASPGTDRADYTTPAWPAAPTGGQLAGRLVLLTVGTLGCAGVVLWLARRSRPLPGMIEGTGPKVVVRVALAGQSALHLVQVDGAGFVVATDPNGLKAIHALAEPFEDLVEANEEESEPCALAPRRVV